MSARQSERAGHGVVPEPDRGVWRARGPWLPRCGPHRPWSHLLGGCGSAAAARWRPGYLDEFLPALSEAFLAVFDCPVPVIAAVNGHAIAGGCVLACACDHRVMNQGHGRIGVTELLVGVPFPITALEILRFAVGTRRLSELACFGRTYRAAEAVGLGLVDRGRGRNAGAGPGG